MRKIIITLVMVVVLSAGCVTVVTAPTPVTQPEPPSLPEQPATATPVPQTVAAPTLNYPEVAIFTVTPANILSGEYATLTWDVRNSYDVEIEPGLTIIRPQGSQPVNPAFTTTYRLTATNAQGFIVATTTLTVSGAPPTIDTPVIKSFIATPYVIRKGGSSILSWQTINGSSVSIDRDVGTVSGEGSKEVSPTTTTTYMLTVTSPEGAQFQTVTVNVK